MDWLKCGFFFQNVGAKNSGWHGWGKYGTVFLSYFTVSETRSKSDRFKILRSRIELISVGIAYIWEWLKPSDEGEGEGEGEGEE